MLAGRVDGHFADEDVVQARHQCGREHRVRVARPEASVPAEAAREQLSVRRRHKHALVAGRELQRLVRADARAKRRRSHARTCYKQYT